MQTRDFSLMLNIIGEMKTGEPSGILVGISVGILTVIVILALHHPPVSLGSRWLDAIGLAEPERLFAITDRFAQVRAILFGHAHQAYARRRRGVLLVCAPATSAQFLPGSDDFAMDDRPPGWHVLSLAADGDVQTTFRWLDPA